MSSPFTWTHLIPTRAELLAVLEHLGAAQKALTEAERAADWAGGWTGVEPPSSLNDDLDEAWQALQDMAERLPGETP